MKKNNKGFFLAETIVVIALVTTVMAFVYPNVTKLYDNYVNRTKYYDQTEDLYTLKVLADWMEETPFIYTDDENSNYQYTLLEYITMDDKQSGCLTFMNELKTLYDSDKNTSFSDLNRDANLNSNLYSLQYCPTKELIINDTQTGGTCSYKKVFQENNQYDNNFSIFSSLKKIYITNYMSNLSNDNYNFNKYLKRLKKTTYDTTSYRLIGIFKENGKTRYASIKINNPNPNRSCNLGGETNE